MASAMIFFLTALISIMINISPSTSSSKLPVEGFEARLIHRNSPESPLYNPMATRADLIKSARLRSIARQNYFKWLLSGKKWRSYISAPVDKDHGDYIMRFKIGTPRVDTFGLFDTGSTLIWMQCQPCKQCFKQRIPIYDPAKSASYVKVMCGSIECNTTTEAQCPDPKGECKYKVTYKDESFSEGDIATETIMLEDDVSSGSVNLTKMIIGCGLSNVDHAAEYNPPGVVGMSRESSSLNGQIEFLHVSYCLPTEDKGTHSSVKFGLPAVITEAQTPLLHGLAGLYFLSLEDISVGGTRLNISSSVFSMPPDGDGGVFLDSGTTYTHLANDAFWPLKGAILDALSDFTPLTDFDRVFELCYNNKRFTLDKSPEIVFHFTRLDFPLSTMNTWDTNSQGYYCLAIKLSDDKYTIIGSYQHRNVNVGVDFKNNFVSFKYTDCK